jgi:hypothetical protein
LTRPPGRPKKNSFRIGEEGRVPKKRACKKCGVLGHIARTCSNPVDASFGEEERWTAANAEKNAAAMEIEDAEENAAAMEIEDAEENAATLEIKENEVVPAPWYVFAFIECSYPFFAFVLFLPMSYSSIYQLQGEKA